MQTFPVRWSRVSRSGLVCALLVVVPGPATAQPSPEVTIADPPPRMVQGAVPLALPTYSPETRWAIGAALIFYRRPYAERVPTTSVKLGIVGTQQRQFSVSTVVDQYLAGRAMRLSFTGSARRFPDLFWAVGPASSEASREEYRRDELTADVSLLFYLAPGLCIGPAARVERFRIADSEAGGNLRAGQVVGATGTDAWTAGLQFEWDTRDSVFFPHEGGLTVVKANLGGAASDGSVGTLARADVDTRWFYRLHDEHVLALQAVVQLRSGTTPFELMPVLGGDQLMRGYYQGRYRDAALLALQAEYRFPLMWRLGGVVFAGTGEVAPGARELASGPLHTAGGLGLRVTLDRAEHINLRVDVAVNQRGETGAYLSIAEAF